jgi:L-iditol 2-dehydrogenase
MSIPKTMKAAVLFGKGDMRLVDDYPVPTPDKEEVLIKVEACAICGTDPRIRAEGWPNHPPYGEFVFGHEYAGTVAALGEGVTAFKIGDRVAVEPHKGCGKCDNCRDGLYTTCLNYGNKESGHRHYGFSTNGGYAEYATIHTNCVSKIPDSMSMEEATLITTAGTSLYGIRRIGGIQTGDTVVVSGPGPIGLMAVVMARLLGAGTIILTGTRPERLELGLKLGADVTINVREENVVERVLALTDGLGTNAVIECSGSAQAAVDAIDYTIKSGRIVLIGLFTEPIPVDGTKVALSNITIAGSRAEGQRSVPRSLALLSRKPIDISPLITHTFPLDDIHAAFETVEKRLDGAIKVVVKP